MDLSFMDQPFGARDEDAEARDGGLDMLEGVRPDQLGPERALMPPMGAAVKEQMKIVHGTTTLGFKYKDGVIIAVDSRASAGAYIASQNVKKVIEINEFLLGTMAGGAADCQFWQRYLGMRCRLFELNHKERISVAAASKLLQNILYGYRGYGLSIGTMIAGWDHKGPGLYYCDSEGTRVTGNLFSVGSGSLFAYGILDSNYSYDMTYEQAVELGRRAIYHATHNDAYSGGTVRVYHIDGKGWRRISEDDSTKLHYQYNNLA